MQEKEDRLIDRLGSEHNKIKRKSKLDPGKHCEPQVLKIYTKYAQYNKHKGSYHTSELDPIEANYKVVGR